MSDPRIALRALQQIRGGGDTPMALARRAVLSRGAPQDYYDQERSSSEYADMAPDISMFSDGRPQAAYNPSSLRGRSLDEVRSMRGGAPQDYYDPEQEAADSLDEYDYGATATPGDPFPERPFDPGDEGRAAAIRAYNVGPKPGADNRDPNAAFIGRAMGRPRGRGYESEFDFVKRPMRDDEYMDEGGPQSYAYQSEGLRRDNALRNGTWAVQQREAANKGRPMRDDERGEAMMGIDDDESTEYGPSGSIARGEYDRPVYEDVSIGMPSSVRSAGVSGNPRGYGPAYNFAQQRAAEFIPRDPRNSAEAVNDLGAIFARLGEGSAYRGAPRVTTAPMSERYSAAGGAPQVGQTPGETEDERRRMLAMGGR